MIHTTNTKNPIDFPKKIQVPTEDGIDWQDIRLVAGEGKLTQKTIGKDKLLWAIYLVSGAVTVITESEWIAMFLGAGALTWFVRRPKRPTSSRTPESSDQSSPDADRSLTTSEIGRAHV